MPQDLFVSIEKNVPQTEQVGVDVMEISMVFADAATAGVLSIVLAPKDAATGLWRTDVEPILVRIVDDLTANPATAPLTRYAATAYHAFLLRDISNPLVALLAALWTTRGHDIMSMNKSDASKVMLPDYLNQP